MCERSGGGGLTFVNLSSYNLGVIVLRQEPPTKSTQQPKCLLFISVQEQNRRNDVHSLTVS